MAAVIGQGLLWGILGIGIFLTYRILDFPDMTTEGSFPLGGAVCATLIHQGFSPLIATLVGVASGMCAGLVTGLLYTKGKIPVILSGILVMSGLNAVMLFVMKTPNLSLLGKSRIQDIFPFNETYNTLFLGITAVILVIILLSGFFLTDFGQSYIATGDNESMARSIGIHTDRMKRLGLVVSNGIIALSGALVTQNDGYADVSKGIGVIVIGLAAIIIAEVAYKEVSLTNRLVTIVLGSIIYQFLIYLIIRAGFDTTYLKLYSSTILAICLMVPQVNGSFIKRFGKGVSR